MTNGLQIFEAASALGNSDASNVAALAAAPLAAASLPVAPTAGLSGSAAAASPLFLSDSGGSAAAEKIVADPSPGEPGALNAYPSWPNKLDLIAPAAPVLHASATDGVGSTVQPSAVDGAAPTPFASALDPVSQPADTSGSSASAPVLYASATDALAQLHASATDVLAPTKNDLVGGAPALVSPGAVLHGSTYYGELPAGFTGSGDADYTGVFDGINVTSSGDQTIVSNAGTGMSINITWDASVSGAPALFKNDVLIAAAMFTRSFTNAISININVGYGEVNGSALGSGALGQSLTFLQSYSYSQIRAALASSSSDGFDQSALANLPASDPIGGTYWLTTAQAKALGLSSSTGVDGYVGFSNSSSFAYDVNNRAVGGSYDFVGTVMHELSEVMGRQRIAGGTIGSTSNSYSLLDLFSYSGSGVRSVIGGNTSYFSIDGGATNLGSFNTISGGDWGDWASSAGNDSGLAFSNSGTANVWMNRDMVSLDVLGYHRAAAVQGDLTNDGTADILLQSNGTVVDWKIGSNSVSGSGVLGTASGWTVVAEGDFNGDGSQDILLRNASGTIVDWTMTNGVVSGGSVIGNAGAFNVVGTGDFNGDGTTDILLQNASGTVVDWTMKNGGLLGTAVIGGAGSFSVVGVGDFNADGTSDILLQNSSGTVVDWMISNNAYSTGHVVGGASGWSVVGVGDFNGDKTSDILFQNASGQVITWNMANGTYSSGASIGQAGSYSVVAVGDYNMDGTSDVLLRNSSGTVVEWNMSGNTVARSAVVGGTGAYTVVST